MSHHDTPEAQAAAEQINATVRYTAWSVFAATEPLVDASQPGATLIADQQRAYLSAPAEGLLVEIDFADGARIARTFETATEPAFTALTGR